MGNNAGGNDCGIYEDVVCCPIITAGWTQNIHDKHLSEKKSVWSRFEHGKSEMKNRSATYSVEILDMKQNSGHLQKSFVMVFFSSVGT
jgi:hypothetical protein